jgi:hypothetical protein
MDSTVTNGPDEPAARTMEARILQRPQPPKQQLSYIDKYFDDALVVARKVSRTRPRLDIEEDNFRNSLSWYFLNSISIG